MGKGWFGPKTVGWGVSPKSWQGWVVSIAIVLGVAASTRWLVPAMSDMWGVDRAPITAIAVAAWIAIYGAIIWLTYERKA